MAEMLLGKPLFKGSDRILHCLLSVEILSPSLLCNVSAFSTIYTLQLLSVTFDPEPLPDLDQLREIMKITGTPTPDFVVKLQSQDVSARLTLIQLFGHKTFLTQNTH